MAWPKKVEAVLSCGRALHNFGINNWALTKEQALDSLEEFRRLDMPVLGGDVYEVSDGKTVPNYDNWYCDRNSDETGKDYVARSIAKAREFITHYANPSGRETLFVLVPHSLG